MSASNGKGRKRCVAKTKAGKRCRAASLHDADVCLAHADAKTRESTGFIARNGKAGRKPNPSAIDVLRDRIQADIDKWLKPLEDALSADRAVVVGDGPSAHVEFVPDYPTRLKALHEALDRGFGKAATAIDLKHSFEESEIDREIRELLSQLPAPNGDRAHA